MLMNNWINIFINNFKEKAALYLLLLRESKWVIIVSIMMGLIVGTSTMLLISLIIKIAREGSSNNYSFYLFSFVGLLGVRAFSAIMSSVLLIKIAQNVVMKLRIILSKKILNLALRQLEQLGEARILACLTNDIPTIAEAFYQIPSIIISIATILICTVFIGIISFYLLLTTLLVMALGVGIYTNFAIKGNNYFRKSREVHDTLYEHFKTLTNGFKEIKINKARREYFLSDEIGVACKKNLKYNIRGQKLYSLADGLGQVFFFVPVGVALFLFSESNLISQDHIVFYIFTVIYCIGPVSNLVGEFPVIARAKVAASRIDELIRSLDEAGNNHIYPTIDHGNIVKGTNKLELRKITYVHERINGDKGFSIGPLNLVLNAGEIVFLAGGNGSGKSTLAKLIAGLYFPKTGSVKLNGIKINEYNIEWYYKHLAIIFSDCFLFENLIGADKKEISIEAKKYLKKFGVNNKTRIFEGKYTSLALSDGERKRIALISMLLEDRDIYIFDEWAAHQDFKFKEMFYTEILRILKRRQKIVLVITHDDQYFRFADRIVKMDFGKINGTNIHCSDSSSAKVY
jgi:putative pyoverdin transport system ATP-binding/permease protein